MSVTIEAANNLKDYLPLIGVVIGGSLAVIGGFASSILVEWYRNASDSKKLAFAFKGELQALSSITKKRGYIEYLKLLISQMEATGQPVCMQLHSRREYFNVFNANVSNIGVLKNPLPEMIAIFYVQANSIMEDFQTYREDVSNDFTVEFLIASKKELVSIMEDTFSLADEIVIKIDELYS